MIGVDAITSLFDGWPPLLVDVVGLLSLAAWFGLAVLLAVVPWFPSLGSRRCSRCRNRSGCCCDSK